MNIIRDFRLISTKWYYYKIIVSKITPLQVCNSSSLYRNDLHPIWRKCRQRRWNSCEYKKMSFLHINDSCFMYYLLRTVFLSFVFSFQFGHMWTHMDVCQWIFGSSWCFRWPVNLLRIKWGMNILNDQRYQSELNTKNYNNGLRKFIVSRRIYNIRYKLQLLIRC